MSESFHSSCGSATIQVSMFKYHVHMTSACIRHNCANPEYILFVFLCRVASNLMLKARQNRKHYSTIRTLLLNCVKLLDQERHPQVILEL